jgi:hypothetical protein
LSARGSLLISEEKDISCLRQDFLNDPIFSAKIQEIEKLYVRLRCLYCGELLISVAGF